MSSIEDEALLAAIGAADVDRVARLLAQKASPRACRHGWPALHLAAHSGNTQLGELLLDAGADIDELMVTQELIDRTRYEGSATPLLIALRAPHESFANLLLARGANVQLSDAFSGENALLLAARHGLEVIVERVLARGPAGDCRCRLRNESPLDAATRGGHIRIVRTLLAAGQRVTARSLSEACRRGHLDLAKLLVDAGAILNDVSDASPLLAAAGSGRVFVIKWLLSQGADVSSQGARALHCAANAGQTEAALVFVERGVDINARDRSDWTPLMTAAWQGHRETCQAFLAAGADPALKESTGKTALDWARQSHCRDAVSILEEWEKSMGDTSTTLQRPCC
jgi:ankyrin repeat protein